MMGHYAALIGKRVEAQYRAGDIQLSARGALVAVTAKAVFLQERFVRNGREKNNSIRNPLRLSALPLRMPSNPTTISPAHRPGNDPDNDFGHPIHDSIPKLEPFLVLPLYIGF